MSTAFASPPATILHRNRLDLFVPGDPIPQGSKKAFANKKTGRIVVVEDNKRTRPWRSEVISALQVQWDEREALPGPVWVRLRFYVTRPLGHFGAHGLLPSAPAFPAGSRIDIDKLERTVLDALTQSGVLRDDGQVVVLKSGKFYAERPGVEIRVRELPSRLRRG